MPLLDRKTRAHADVLQRAAVIIKSQKQRTNRRALAFLVPAKSRDYAIAVALMLHLEHDALVRLIRSRDRLGYHAIQARAFKSPKPIRSHRSVPRCRRQMNRRLGRTHQLFQPLPPFLERLFPQIARALAEQIEKHDRRRNLFRQKLHARCRRVQPQLQILEIQRAIFRDDDLAIQHGACRQLRAQLLHKLWKITVQRLFIAALDEDLVAVAKHQRAKSVPLRFENPHVAFRQLGHSFGQHRKQRRIHRKIHASWYPATPGALGNQHSGNPQLDVKCSEKPLAALPRVTKTKSPRPAVSPRTLASAELRALIRRADGVLSPKDCRTLRSLVRTVEDLARLMSVNGASSAGEGSPRKQP